MSRCLILLITLFLTPYLFSQIIDDTLIGMVNQKLVKINQNTGQTIDYVPITNFPSTAPIRLAWKESEQCYYTIGYIGNSPRTIGRITANGVYSNLGQISIPGNTAYLIEGIAINPSDNQLYACVSLNGGTSSGDFWSETLIRVNTSNMTGVIIGQFNHTIITNNPNSEPEADVIAFDQSGNLYYFDAEPNPEAIRIYQQEMTFTQPAVLRGTSSYVPIFDMTIKGDNVYFGTNQNLRRFNLISNTFSTIGNMTPPSLFSGQEFKGLTWKVDNTSSSNWLNFDGANDYVNINPIASSMAGLNQYTIEFLIHVKEPQQEEYAVFYGINGPQGLGDINKLVIRLAGPDEGGGNSIVVNAPFGGNFLLIGNANVLDSNCHHVAYTYNNGLHSLYIDGVFQGTMTKSVSLANNDRHSLGQEFDVSGTSQLLTGSMDEFRVWNTIRTVTEIGNNMNNELTGSETGLITYFNFNQGISGGNNTSITSLINTATSSQNGTLIGFQLTSGISNFITVECSEDQNCTPFDFLPESTSFCDGNSQTITPTLTGNWTYSWNTQQTTPSISVNTGGNYILTINDGVCSYSDTTQVTVNQETHTTSFTNTNCISPNSGSITINSNQATQYSFDNGATWGSTNIQTGLIAGTYTVISQTPLGCTHSSVVTISTQSNHLPIVTSGDTSVCENGTANLWADVPGSSETILYYWNNNSSNFNSTNSFTANSNVLVSVYATNQLGTCISDTIDILVSILIPEWGNIIVNPAICGIDSSGSVTLNALNGNSNVLEWNISGFSGQTNNTIENLSEGYYTISYTNLDGCLSEDTTIFIGTTNLTNADFNVTPSTGTAPVTIDIVNTSTNATNYSWSMNGVYQGDFFDGFNADSSGTYTIQLVAWNNDSLCADTTSVTITIYEDETFTIPNIFTPNNDNINDYFSITTNATLEIELVIINRWGNVMYETNKVLNVGVNNLWDGKNASDGVYFYLLKILSNNEINSNQNNFPISKQGFITIAK